MDRRPSVLPSGEERERRRRDGNRHTHGTRTGFNNKFRRPDISVNKISWGGGHTCSELRKYHMQGSTSSVNSTQVGPSFQKGERRWIREGEKVSSSFSLDPSGEIHLDSQEGSDKGGGLRARLGQYNTVRRGRRKKWKRGHFEILHTASGVGPTLFHPPSVPMLHARTDGLAPTPAPLESVPRSGISKRWDFPFPGARMFPPICVSGARAERRGRKAGSSLIAFWGLSILRPVAKVRGESGGGVADTAAASSRTL